MDYTDWWWRWTNIQAGQSANVNGAVQFLQHRNTGWRSSLEHPLQLDVIVPKVNKERFKQVILINLLNRRKAVFF
jgi:hypothetical protein